MGWRDDELGGRMREVTARCIVNPPKDSVFFAERVAVHRRRRTKIAVMCLAVTAILGSAIAPAINGRLDDSSSGLASDPAGDRQVGERVRYEWACAEPQSMIVDSFGTNAQTSPQAAADLLAEQYGGARTALEEGEFPGTAEATVLDKEDRILASAKLNETEDGWSVARLTYCSIIFD